MAALAGRCASLASACASGMNQTSRDQVRSEASSRQAAIGCLRLLFALAVIYSHAYFLGGFGSEPIKAAWFNQAEFLGGLAVKGFFVLSGFLIVRSEVRLNDTRLFLWHRFLRIMPALWVCLALTAFVLAPITAGGYSGTWTWPAGSGYLWHNLLRPRQQIDINSLPLGVYWNSDWNGSLWTLEYELACYAIVAFVGWLGLLRLRPRFACLAGAAVLTVFLWDHLVPHRQLFFKIVNRDMVAFFAAGGIAGLVPAGWWRTRRAKYLAAAAAGALITSCWVGGYGLLGPLLLCLVVLGVAMNWRAPDIERRLGGDYSYGLYIFAYPLQQTLAYFHLQRWGVGVFLGLNVAATAGVAVLSWHLVEKHALAWKDRLPRRSSRPVLAPRAANLPAEIRSAT